MHLCHSQSWNVALFSLWCLFYTRNWIMCSSEKPKSLSWNPSLKKRDKEDINLSSPSSTKTERRAWLSREEALGPSSRTLQCVDVDFPPFFFKRKCPRRSFPLRETEDVSASPPSWQFRSSNKTCCRKMEKAQTSYSISVKWFCNPTFSLHFVCHSLYTKLPL